MEPDSDRLNINLFLKITFVVLSLFLIGELVYFFYIVPNKKITTNKVTPTLTSTPTPEPTKAPTPISFTTPSAKQEFTGKIVEINTHTISPIPGFDNIGFSFKLERNEGAAKKPSVVFFDKNELNYIKVTDPSGKTISYKELKIGQNIRIKNGLTEINVLNIYP